MDWYRSSLTQRVPQNASFFTFHVESTVEFFDSFADQARTERAVPARKTRGERARVARATRFDKPKDGSEDIWVSNGIVGDIGNQRDVVVL